MRQIFLQKGFVHLKDVDVPLCNNDSVLVQVHYSFVSSGTEGATVTSSGKSLIEKFSSNVTANTNKILGTVKEHGLAVTLALIKEKSHQVMALGYSCSGQVIAIGNNIHHLRVGDYVACAGSGIAHHAEIVVVPQNLAVRIHDETYVKQASLTTIGAIALQGVRRASLQLGEKVCVIGLGLIGQLTVQLAKLAGCQVFGVDLQEHRLMLAQKFGAHAVFNGLSKDIITGINFATDYYGTDATIITAASSSGDLLQQAMNITRRKGRVVLVGDVKIDFDRNPFYSKEIDLLISCSYGPGRYDDKYEKQGSDYPYAYVRWTENRNMEFFVNLIQNGTININDLITHEYDIDDANQAYQALKKELTLGLVLSYHPKKVSISSKEIKTNFETTHHAMNKHHVISYTAHDKEIKLALLGAGGFAKVKLLPIIAKISSAKIHTIVDLDVANSINTAQQYGAVQISNNYQNVLNNDLINAVVIATPHCLHADQAIDCMRAGKAVFVEKPAAVNNEQFATLKTFLHKHGTNILYCVDFNRSFSPFMQSIKKIVKNRSNPMMIYYRMNAGYLPKDHWIQSSINGGRIIGEGCHIFELFCFLTDAQPTSISVKILNVRHENLLPSDNFIATINMSDGSCCSFIYTALGNAAMGKERMELFVDGKSIVMDNFLKLTGYGFPLSFNRKVNVQDRGHKQLLAKFFEAAQNKNIPAPITHERILTATAISLVVDRLARAGGGFESI